jgi:hypothetical protein
MRKSPLSLEDRIFRLHLQAGRLARQHPDPADFWPAFASRADALLDGLGPKDDAKVRGALDRILSGQGIQKLGQEN